ncbi:MAG TPA: hypothetical protein VM487_03315 [Phycisphaerae bacterium]|nr:hypothetical protein [Phycisphaerae bacterium]
MRDELGGPPVPDLVVWRHLPRALYGVDRDYHGLVPVNPDRVVEDLVPAAASLLASMAILMTQAPSQADRDRIRKHVDDAYRNTRKRYQQSGQEVPPFMTHAAVASAQLPYAWRAVLFSSVSRTRKAVSSLSKWSYWRRLWSAAPGLLTFCFKNHEQHDLWATHEVRKDLVVSIHDMFTLHLLWSKLGYDTRFDEPAQLHLHRPVHPPDLQSFVTLDEEDVRADLTIPAGDDLLARVRLADRLEHYSALSNEVLFTVRVAGCSAIAECLLGPHWRATLDPATEKLHRIAPVLNDAQAAIRASNGLSATSRLATTRARA